MWSKVLSYILILVTAVASASSDGQGSLDEGAGIRANRGTRSSLTRLKRSLVHTFSRFPGTNWCGAGHRASSIDDFGSFVAVDACCRQHDLSCPAAILTGETFMGLTNDGRWTALHCSCDERFRNCLRMSNSAAANMVGSLFYNVLKKKCFMFKTQKVCENSGNDGKFWNFFRQEQECSNKRVAVFKDPLPY